MLQSERISKSASIANRLKHQFKLTQCNPIVNYKLKN